MSWELIFLPEAEKDMQALDGSQRLLVAKALEKVRKNPLSIYDGGYGKPLGNHNGSSLAGLFKVKLRNAGLRFVYKLIYMDTEMLVIVIGARADEEVYKTAQKRIQAIHD